MSIEDKLRDFARAYPEDVFTPFTGAERKTYPILITRASAEMGRHFAPFAIEAADSIAALEARCRELEKECDDADFMDARIADLERQLSQYKEAFHKAFNQFENITVSDTLAVVKERAHQMIGWAYAVLPDYALETTANEYGLGK